MKKLSITMTILLAVLLTMSCNTEESKVKQETEKTTTEKTKAPEEKTEKKKEENYGIITKRSFVDVKTTMDRLEKIISKKEGVRVFTRINHAENSRNAGNENVADSELVIFGNPKVGLKMLSKDPRAGIDLPLKILAYVGEDENTYISYRDVLHYKNIYNLENCKATEKMSNSINKLSSVITKSPEDFKLFLEKSKTKK